MSTGGKFCVRPKVRFSANDTDELRTKEIKNADNRRHVNKGLCKPTIKSIVTLDQPVKLVKLNEPSNNEGLIRSKVNDNVQKVNSSTDAAPLNAQPLSTLNKNFGLITENEIPSHKDSSIQNTDTNSKDTAVRRASAKASCDNVPASDSPRLQLGEKLGTKVLKPKNDTPPVATKKRTNVKSGKENTAMSVKRTTKSVVSKCTDSKIKTSCSNAKTSLGKAVDKPSSSNLPKKVLKAKPIVNGVMPCYKHNKAMTGGKTAPTKKSVLRDVIGPKIKPCVEPGISHKKSDVLKLVGTDKATSARTIDSANKLARPEYNSIICTINKLNEIKKEKVVTDFDHLPRAYKNLVNGKISAALDFPLDEAIYKNLVDLSVDESQLPCRLTRSKDPEPRQKDMAPVLSDFFMPTPTQEYCMSASITPRTPEIIDSWSAFSISDQICEWKYILDHTQ